MKFNLFIITFFFLSTLNIYSQELGRRPNLGISLKPLTKEIAEELGYTGNSKLYVQNVRPNSTASSLGIRAKDIIINYAGVPIGPGFYDKIKSKYRDGDKITAVSN